MKSYGLRRVLFVRLFSATLILAVTACVAVAKPHGSRKGKAPADSSRTESAASAPKGAKSGSAAAASRPSGPIHHTIARGQTLYRIASLYGVSVKEICRTNRIKNPARVKAGTVIEIPRRPSPGKWPVPNGSDESLLARAAPAGTDDQAASEQFVGPLMEGRSAHRGSGPTRPASAAHPSAPVCSEKARAAASAPACIAAAPGGDHAAALGGAEPCAPDEDEWADEEGASDIGPSGVTYTLIPSDDPFSWPVQGGTIFSPFGKRRGRLHAGVDIAAPQGTLVYAARDGMVTFSGRKRGYGNVVIVDHGDGFATLYAHNSKNTVRQGARVVRGQMIARVGATGNATGAHCHFEIRKTNLALDPTRYLTAMTGPTMTASTGGTKTEKPPQINKAGIGAGLLPIP